MVALRFPSVLTRAPVPRPLRPRARNQMKPDETSLQIAPDVSPPAPTRPRVNLLNPRRQNVRNAPFLKMAPTGHPAKVRTSAEPSRDLLFIAFLLHPIRNLRSCNHFRALNAHVRKSHLLVRMHLCPSVAAPFFISNSSPFELQNEPIFAPSRLPLRPRTTKCTHLSIFPEEDLH